uniref:Uncharacterized protein n=1 Tax=Timema cristinae TaxID=61476 RepID=A0A7R9DT90_TIMCR|nr:unnamed protein product [Timema cristinae]
MNVWTRVMQTSWRLYTPAPTRWGGWDLWDMQTFTPTMGAVTSLDVTQVTHTRCLLPENCQFFTICARLSDERINRTRSCDKSATGKISNGFYSRNRFKVYFHDSHLFTINY